MGQPDFYADVQVPRTKWAFLPFPWIIMNIWQPKGVRRSNDHKGNEDNPTARKDKQRNELAQTRAKREKKKINGKQKEWDTKDIPEL